MSYLVLDEVNLWFAGLSWGSSWDDDILLFLWFLDQNVDQSLLFILNWSLQDWCLVGWRRRSLDEDNFVVLLGHLLLLWALDADLLLLWWWNVHVNVFLLGIIEEFVKKCFRDFLRIKKYINYLDYGLLASSGISSEA